MTTLTIGDTIRFSRSDDGLQAFWVAELSDGTSMTTAIEQLTMDAKECKAWLSDGGLLLVPHGLNEWDNVSDYVATVLGYHAAKEA